MASGITLYCQHLGQLETVILSRALRAAAGDTCPTCGGAPGPGTVGRCAACVEGEWAKLRIEMGEEWVRRHRYGEGG